MNEREIYVIELWENQGEFAEELKNFINRKDITVHDIQYSAVNDSEYSQTGYTAVVIFTYKNEKENDNE